MSESGTKNILILLIGLYVLSCSGGSNKSADQHWKDGQRYRTETKLMESITSFKSIINTYPLHELAARYGVSAERIRQLEKNAMKKLKSAVVLEA